MRLKANIAFRLKYTFQNGASSEVPFFLRERKKIRNFSLRRTLRNEKLEIRNEELEIELLFDEGNICEATSFARSATIHSEEGFMLLLWKATH